MAKLIGSITSDNYGENLFISKAVQYFDENCIIYWNRPVYGREFDVCILLPGKGILVVELKGWKEDTILRIENSDTFVIKATDTPSGEAKERPQKQARGYRFALERHIKQSINKFPLVFSMVCLPQISKEYYEKNRLDVLLEKSFTILKEDIADTASFFSKINEAFSIVSHWNRDVFDSRTMLEVRNLFETDVDPDENTDSVSPESTIKYREYPYSMFYYVGKNESDFETKIKKLVNLYVHGTKIYCVFNNQEQLTYAVSLLDQALIGKGLQRNRDDLSICFDDEIKHTPEVSGFDFSAFNISFSTCDNEEITANSMLIQDGNYSSSEQVILKQLDSSCGFNASQYFVEHTNPDKNIVIRAGAGTGKTYTMISRIGYICYAHKMPLTNILDQINMITFTNEAADQMEEKLKKYFKNCYLLSSQTEYLSAISVIDNMQISTIHSFAQKLIATLGTEFGYGIDLGITSSEFYRRKKIVEIVDTYIHNMELRYGRNYVDQLGTPVYTIIDKISEFIEKLHNKSIDVAAIQPSDFGSNDVNDAQTKLHQLFAYVIPKVEKDYENELLQNNKIHLGSMMSVLNKFLTTPANENRIKELNNGYRQYMFVDEFQDTDDTQIEILLILAKYLNYRLFLVGDVKQCIYRFRGAEEEAFNKVGINPSTWQEYQLQKNYRTDAKLLDIFDKSFTTWNSAMLGRLLTYSASFDRLRGTRDYNGYIKKPSLFYRHIDIDNEEKRIPTLVDEIHRLQRRVKYEIETRKQPLSQKERTIAILVRYNWQAEMIRSICEKNYSDLNIQTNTGGDLYMSQPALDMLTLVNALVHYDEADYLYNFVSSNFFSVDVPKSKLFTQRVDMKTGGWRAKADERTQVNYLLDFMNRVFPNQKFKDVDKWESIIRSIRVKPILQVVREIYSILEPWKNYSSDAWKQHYYQLNVDLLFEEVINACNTDHLTISTLQSHLIKNIAAQTSVESRIPPEKKKDNGSDIPIHCITVHKSKGLEYGHVILPYCSFSINTIKKNQLHVSTEKDYSTNSIRIGYRMNFNDSDEPIQNDFYNESQEKSDMSREETRILYVAMTRAITSFSWIELSDNNALSWQNLIESEN